MQRLLLGVRKALFCGDFTDPSRVPARAGIYAIFLRNGAELASVPFAQDRLLYIGIAGDSLLKRSHFLHPTSSASTLRRSLGALGVVSGLSPRPRGRDHSAKNCAHYWFDGPGEGALSCWMKTNLRLRWTCDLPQEKLEEIEKLLIRELEPVLNIQHARHGFVATLRGHRRRFAKLAKGWPGR